MVEQGDSADRFYVVAAGTVEVSVDGRPSRNWPRRLLRGDRADARSRANGDGHARTEVVSCALDRDDFLAAVAGHAPSAEAAEEVVELTRLA